MRRLALATLAVVVLVAGAGCLGSGGVSDDQLAENATYAWNASANGTIDLSTGSYRAVFRVSNQSELRLATPTDLAGDSPVSVSAVQFRYPNGTVVNSSAIEVDQTRSETIVHLPAADGQFGYTASAGERVATLPTPVKGSYEVVLPGGMDVDLPVFGHVSPGGYDRSYEDGRVHLRWDDVSGDSVEVNYYYRQDLYIYGGVVLLALLAGGAGAFYIRLQIRRLREYRRDAGLDVE